MFSTLRHVLHFTILPHPTAQRDTPTAAERFLFIPFDTNTIITPRWWYSTPPWRISMVFSSTMKMKVPSDSTVCVNNWTWFSSKATFFVVYAPLKRRVQEKIESENHSGGCVVLCVLTTFGLQSRFWGQITQISSGLSPERDCRPKGVECCMVRELIPDVRCVKCYTWLVVRLRCCMPPHCWEEHNDSRRRKHLATTYLCSVFHWFAPKRTCCTVWYRCIIYLLMFLSFLGAIWSFFFTEQLEHLIALLSLGVCHATVALLAVWAFGGAIW